MKDKDKCADTIGKESEDSGKARVYTPYPGADEKYDDGNDWRIYNPDKYRDPNWAPEKE